MQLQLKDSTKQHPNSTAQHDNLVQPEGLAHAALDVKAAHILPVLLQQRHQKVDAHLNVDVQVLLSHGHIADCHSHAQHLLQLELDGGLDLIHLQHHNSIGSIAMFIFEW